LVTFVRTHPVLTALYVSGYFLAGAAWSIVKWWFAETNRVREARDEFRESRDIRTWSEFIKNRKSDPTNYKSDIIAWITFWPFSLVWTLLNDPVRRLCRRIYDELQGVYQRITD